MGVDDVEGVVIEGQGHDVAEDGLHPALQAALAQGRAGAAGAGRKYSSAQY